MVKENFEERGGVWRISIVIDCKGGSNREIDVPDALKDVDLDGINPDAFGHRAKTLNTDEMAALAYRAGYDGVVFKDVMDVASELHEWDPVATDYVVFNSSQVKSADPVTYDDNGNVIPLSERFNEKQNDIRYSVARTTDGRNCVFADSDILHKGKINGRTEVQAVADAIMSIVVNDYTVLSTGNVTYIGKDLPGEYLHSKSAARLVKANKSIIKAKNLASGHLGELIEIAVNPKWQQNQKEKHGINAQRGWLRYDVRFAVPVLDKERKMTGAKIYDATLLVRMDADGKDYLYDMIGIKIALRHWCPLPCGS